MKIGRFDVSLTRVLRLAIGLFFLFAAYDEKSWAMAFIGSMLFIQGLFNVGCGMANGSCAAPDKSKTDSKFDADKAFRKLQL
jgi:hypothetical protein